MGLNVDNGEPDEENEVEGDGDVNMGDMVDMEHIGDNSK